MLLLFLLIFSAQTAEAAEIGGDEGHIPGSGGRGVSYEVFFVDEEDTSRKILNSQRGTVAEGAKLRIHFPRQIVGTDGYIWEALSESPRTEPILSPGTQKIYIRFQKKELAVKPEEEDEGREKLTRWLRIAWEADCEITGRDPAGSPPPLIVEDGADNDSRIKNLVTMVDDTRWHYFYLIGKNYKPQTLILGTGFDAEYSSAVMESFVAGKDAYTVVKAGIKRYWRPQNCSHRWKKSGMVLNSCLNQGRETITCEKCKTEKTILLPALGHVDADGDSLCDRCKKRTFEQNIGDRLQTALQTPTGPVVLNFTCLDDNYLGSGKLLYLADEVLGQEITGACFLEDESYEESALRRYFRLGFVNELSIGAALLPIPWPDFAGASDYAGLLSQKEYEAYREQIGEGERYFLRTSKEENTIQAVETDGSIVTVPAAENRGYGARPVILLERPQLEADAEPHAWQRGDLQIRKIGGRDYLFRCIDEDFSDNQGTHRSAALFLCDSVIRSDADSDADQLRIFSFGENNNYKNSEVRNWLAAHASDSSFEMEPIYTGVTAAYTGSTVEGMFSQMDASRLKPYEIGFQLLDDRLFCLSVEEAVKYRDELWRFSGADTDNPQTQISPYSGGYYLRTPVFFRGDGGDFCYTDEIYVVDLYLGSIHPAKTDSRGIGLRPAFALPQG